VALWPCGPVALATYALTHARPFTLQHRLLCHMGLYWSEFSFFELSGNWNLARSSGV
jgi:hypothetical protein